MLGLCAFAFGHQAFSHPKITLYQSVFVSCLLHLLLLGSSLFVEEALLFFQLCLPRGNRSEQIHNISQLTVEVIATYSFLMAWRFRFTSSKCSSRESACSTGAGISRILQTSPTTISNYTDLHRLHTCDVRKQIRVMATLSSTGDCSWNFTSLGSIDN